MNRDEYIKYCKDNLLYECYREYPLAEDVVQLKIYDVQDECDYIRALVDNDFCAYNTEAIESVILQGLKSKLDFGQFKPLLDRYIDSKNINIDDIDDIDDIFESEYLQDVAEELLLKNRMFWNESKHNVIYYEGFTKPGLYDFGDWGECHFEHIDDIVEMYEFEKEYRRKEE